MQGKAVLQLVLALPLKRFQQRPQYRLDFHSDCHPVSSKSGVAVIYAYK